MKKPGVVIAQISPSAEGWQILHAGTTKTVATLDEVPAAVPPRVHLHLALPMQLAVLERMTLPATDREELSGMVMLQLEKTLPYPVEEVANDFEIIGGGESESTILSVAVHMEPLGTLVEPLRLAERLPEKITLWAEHIAMACPADASVLAVWPEQGHLIVGICDKAKLIWAHAIPGLDADALAAELPSLLLGAEMEGVTVQFSRALAGKEVAHLSEALHTALNVPVEILATDTPLPEPEGNLEPAAWVIESERADRVELRRQRLVLATVAYLLLVAGAFVYLAWTKKRVQALDAELMGVQPQIQALQASQARWRALAPAIQPSNYAVEILYLANKNLPSPEVRITNFQCGPTQWQVDGEAPTANIAIEYAEKLRGDKELDDWQIVADPKDLKILQNEHTQFRIFGKL